MHGRSVVGLPAPGDVHYDRMSLDVLTFLSVRRVTRDDARCPPEHSVLVITQLGELHELLLLSVDTDTFSDLRRLCW